MAQFSGTLFGPGFAEAGTVVGFAADEGGLRFDPAQAGSPRWSAITLAKSGWDGTQLRLDWRGDAGPYALAVSDPAAVRALAVLASGRAGMAAGSGAATRAWVWGLVAVFFVLPLLLLGVLLWQHERIAAWVVERIPVEQEMKFGAQLFAGHKSDLKLIEGAPQAMVAEIGARLTQGSPYRFHFYVSDDKTVNAYAMPGGFIVVNRGLLALADSADEVAGVLAHEVAHVEKRHSLTALVKSAGLYATTAALFGDLGSLARAGTDLVNRKFSRDHEREADDEGLKRLVKAGFQPAPMATFFRKMAQQGVNVPAFLSTHPASEERFATIDRAVKALPEAARAAPPLPYDYAAIKAALPKQ